MLQFVALTNSKLIKVKKAELGIKAQGCHLSLPPCSPCQHPHLCSRFPPNFSPHLWYPPFNTLLQPAPSLNWHRPHGPTFMVSAAADKLSFLSRLTGLLSEYLSDISMGLIRWINLKWGIRIHSSVMRYSSCKAILRVFFIIPETMAGRTAGKLVEV